MLLASAVTREEVACLVAYLGLYQVDQIHRMVVETIYCDRLVRLIKRVSDDPMQPASEWDVEDVFSGENLLTDERYLSMETFNAMEVLAWATKRT